MELQDGDIIFINRNIQRVEQESVSPAVLPLAFPPSYDVAENVKYLIKSEERGERRLVPGVLGVGDDLAHLQSQLPLAER